MHPHGTELQHPEFLAPQAVPALAEEYRARRAQLHAQGQDGEQRRQGDHCNPCDEDVLHTLEQAESVVRQSLANADHRHIADLMDAGIQRTKPSGIRNKPDRNGKTLNLFERLANRRRVAEREGDPDLVKFATMQIQVPGNIGQATEAARRVAAPTGGNIASTGKVANHLLAQFRLATQQAMKLQCRGTQADEQDPLTIHSPGSKPVQLHPQQHAQNHHRAQPGAIPADQPRSWHCIGEPDQDGIEREQRERTRPRQQQQPQIGQQTAYPPVAVDRCDRETHDRAEDHRAENDALGLVRHRRAVQHDVGENGHSRQQQQVAQAQPKFQGSPGLDASPARPGPVCGEIFYGSM
ncbi:hypothetical protein D3C73_947700 [compost metagenome]